MLDLAGRRPGIEFFHIPLPAHLQRCIGEDKGEPVGGYNLFDELTVRLQRGDKGSDDTQAGISAQPGNFGGATKIFGSIRVRKPQTNRQTPPDDIPVDWQHRNIPSAQVINQARGQR